MQRFFEYLFVLGYHTVTRNVTIIEQRFGEVAERLNAADSKSVMVSQPSGVRIPPSPLKG